MDKSTNLKTIITAKDVDRALGKFSHSGQDFLQFQPETVVQHLVQISFSPAEDVQFTRAHHLPGVAPAGVEEDLAADVR